MCRHTDHSGRVPVSWGSPRFRTRVVGAFEITDAFFPPDAVLPAHTHDRSVVAVTLRGAIESKLSGRTLLGRRDELWTEPVGEKHANRVGPDGAHVLVIQPDPEQRELLDGCRSLLEEVHHFRHPGAGHVARAMIPELARDGPPDRLMLEGLTLQLLAMGARKPAPRGGPHRWFDRSLEFVHAGFRGRMTVSDIAAEVGLHPSYFSRAFKERTGVTVGRYVRSLRLDWASRRLRESDDPVGLIAIRAGFADQSHFTRELRRATGFTPGQMRAARGDVATMVRQGGRARGD